MTFKGDKYDGKSYRQIGGVQVQYPLLCLFH